MITNTELTLSECRTLEEQDPHRPLRLGPDIYQALWAGWWLNSVLESDRFKAGYYYRIRPQLKLDFGG